MGSNNGQQCAQSASHISHTVPFGPACKRERAHGQTRRPLHEYTLAGGSQLLLEKSPFPYTTERSKKQVAKASARL